MSDGTAGASTARRIVTCVTLLLPNGHGRLQRMRRARLDGHVHVPGARRKRPAIDLDAHGRRSVHDVAKHEIQHDRARLSAWHPHAQRPRAVGRRGEHPPAPSAALQSVSARGDARDVGFPSHQADRDVCFERLSRDRGRPHEDDERRRRDDVRAPYCLSYPREHVEPSYHPSCSIDNVLAVLLGIDVGHSQAGVSPWRTTRRFGGQHTRQRLNTAAGATQPTHRVVAWRERRLVGREVRWAVHGWPHVPHERDDALVQPNVRGLIVAAPGQRPPTHPHLALVPIRHGRPRGYRQAVLARRVGGLEAGGGMRDIHEVCSWGRWGFTQRKRGHGVLCAVVALCGRHQRDRPQRGLHRRGCRRVGGLPTPERKPHEREEDPPPRVAPRPRNTAGRVGVRAVICRRQAGLPGDHEMDVPTAP